MPEPLPFFNSGDSAMKALNAGFLNNLVQRVNQFTPTPRTVKQTTGPLSTLECYAINNTSGAFPERSIVAQQSTLGLTVSTDQDKINFQQGPLLNIDVPSATTDFPLVCLEPIPGNGGVGRVAIGGIAVCTVNVTDAGHDYANPTAGDETRLTSASTGQVRILWKDSGTGNKTAVVYLVEAAGGGLYFSTFGAANYNGVRYPILQSFNSQLGTTVVDSYPFTVYGTLGNLVVPAGQTVRGYSVVNVLISTGDADPSDIYLTVRVFSKWNDLSNSIGNRITEVEHNQTQPGTFQATWAFNIPIVATNETGTNRRLTAVAELSQLGGGQIAGANVVSSSTTFTLA